MAAEDSTFPVHLDRTHLPEPEWDYPNAVINTFEADSKADFPPMKAAPDGAPNVLLVLIDDVGFGWPSVNGGLVRMPNAERVHQRGLFYNQFHTTALCAPTRAALLTGRNHHSVAIGQHRRDGDRVSRLLRHHPEELCHLQRAAAGGRLLLRLVGQEPQRPRQPDQPRRAVRQLADRTGLRLLLRIHLR